MKITANEEYGLRIILRIAKIQYSNDNPEETLVRLNDISEAEGMSTDNIAATMSLLKDASLVTSIRGKHGGYKLAKAPQSISLFEIMHALSDKVFSSSFCDSHSGNQSTCSHSQDCSIRPVWQTVYSVIDNVFLSISLEDLMTNEASLASKFEASVQNLARELSQGDIQKV